MITLPPSGAVAQRSPAKGMAPSLSLTATPHELEPPTPDVAEDPLLALICICGFLTSNTTRAWREEELAAMPPLVGLAAYLDPIKEDLERISEMVADKREERGKACSLCDTVSCGGATRTHDHTTNSHKARM